MEQVEQDARAHWLGDITPAEARDRLEELLDADTVAVTAGPPPGVDLELWELRRALGVG